MKTWVSDQGPRPFAAPETTDRDNVVDGMTRMVALLTSIARGDTAEEGKAWHGEVVRDLARECLNKVGITWTRA